MPPAPEPESTGTSDIEIAYWVAHAIFAKASGIALYYKYFGKSTPRYAIATNCVTIITSIASLAYLVMVLSDTTINLSCGDYTRPFEWVRYAQWALVAPMLVVLMANTAQASMADTVFTAGAAVLAVGALFAAALTPNCIASWPLFGFACACGLVVVLQFLFVFRRSVKGSAFEGLYTASAYFLTVLFIGYAVVWGVSEGGKKTTETQEIITYVVLDGLTSGVFGALFLKCRNSVILYGSALGWLA